MADRNANAMFRERMGEGKFVGIGFDPDLKLMPSREDVSDWPACWDTTDYIFNYFQKTHETTHDLADCFKINPAFFYRYGFEQAQLKSFIAQLQARAPEVPVILDFKYGDVPHTMAAHAEFVFDYLKADAVTVSPLFGRDSLEPFIERFDKTTFVVCHSSNDGAGDFQELRLNSPLRLCDLIAIKVADWDRNHNLGLVVGATYPQLVSTVRWLAEEQIILGPGGGTQGGDPAESLRNAGGKLFIPTFSRSVCYPDKTNPEETPREKVVKINQMLANVPR